MAEYGFVVSGMTLPGENDFLGVWTIAPKVAGVSFDASASAAPAGPTWRVRLPESLGAAQSILQTQSLTIQRGEAALAQAEDRLARLGHAGEGVSFAAPAGPEAELLRALSALQPSVSFGLPGKEAIGEQLENLAQWRSFLEQVRDMVTHYARVETEVAGILVGQTAVGWTGDFESIWMPGVALASMQLHHQSVHLALVSRLAFVRMVTIVATGAAGLALTLSVPGGQLMALPAVWKFVRDVLAEITNLGAAHEYAKSQTSNSKGERDGRD
jgi:hypothetical protein